MIEQTLLKYERDFFSWMTFANSNFKVSFFLNQPLHNIITKQRGLDIRRNSVKMRPILKLGYALIIVGHFIFKSNSQNSFLR